MRKQIMAVIIVAALLQMTGCGSSADEAKKEEPNSSVEIAESTTEEDKNVNNEQSDKIDVKSDEVAEQVNGNKIYSSGKKTYTMEDGQYPDGTSEADNYNNQYEEEFILEITGDNTAIYTDIYYYHYGLTSTSKYEGTYVDKGDYIYFKYGSEADGYLIYIDGDTITSSEYFYAYGETEKLVGTFTGNDNVYGDMILTIGDDQMASLSCSNGQEYTGSVSYNNDRWELYGSYEEDFLDWYIYISGSTFTHETYRHALYSRYASDNEMVGDLGTIVLHVDDEGYTYTEVEIDGVLRMFSGNINTDDERGCITGAYLATEDGYTLDLEIETLYDGTINYSGHLSVPLAAG